VIGRERDQHVVEPEPLVEVAEEAGERTIQVQQVVLRFAAFRAKLWLT